MTRGSCLCGTVRWEMEPPFERMHHCHCSMCRKAHAAPFATWMIVARDRFRFTAGAANITGYQSSADYHRAFCTTCGSAVPSLENGDMVDVPAGCLDDDPGVRPEMHIFAASKAPWYEIADSLPRHDGYQPGSEWSAVDGPHHAHGGNPGGSCLCGAVAYEVTEPFRVSYNCHCHRCQKARAAAHTTNASVAIGAFRYIRGEELLVHYKVPEAQFFTQTFCRVCGSGMVPTGSDRPFVTAPLASFDGDPGIAPSQHIYAIYHAPWFAIADNLPQYEEGPAKRPIEYFKD
jgi:hypothetical protein